MLTAAARRAAAAGAGAAGAAGAPAAAGGAAGALGLGFLGPAACQGQGGTTSTPPTAAASPAGATKRELENQYARVQLPMDEDCPLCAALKKTPCFAPFVAFHKCSEYHTQRNEDIVGPCKGYALALNDCLQANAHLLPPEIASQRWQQQGQQKKPEPEAGARRRGSPR